MEVDSDASADALKAVERVLSGAVNKVLSRFKASTEPSTARSSSRTSKHRSRGRDPSDSTEPSTSTARSSKPRPRDSDSSDYDDFQLPPKKPKKRSVTLETLRER